MPTELFLSTDQATAWQASLPAETAVFGSLEFARIVEQYRGYRARLFVLSCPECVVAYPVFLRPVAGLPFASAVCDGEAFDAVTPEFTGPVLIRGALDHSSETFTTGVHQAFVAHNIIAEFMHINPWSETNRLLDSRSIEFNREVVWVDTSLSEEDLWHNHFSYACRKNINRSIRNKVRICEATTLDDIREFYRIYIQTMDRRKAATSYYFPFEYFASIFHEMKSHARFVMAACGDEIVAATLYLHDRSNVYSYLGGADQDYQSSRPTNAIVYDTIRWAVRKGKKRLVLGGGYRPDDGIYRFKASFSNLRAAFHTYKVVHLQNKYVALERAWCDYYGCDTANQSYFPIYRFVPEQLDLPARPDESPRTVQQVTQSERELSSNSKGKLA